MPDGRLIDISLELGPTTPVFPGDPPVEVETICETPYQLSRLVMTTHSGTHLDAPAHFIPGGATASELSLDALCGPCWVLAVAEPDIAPAHLAAHCPARPVSRLLLKTPEAAGLTEAAARWLVEQGVTLVGIDALSIETDGETYPVHRALLGAGVLILEGLELSQVMPGPYELLCLPLKLSAPDGAPVRAALRSQAD